ncbi:MAG: hypothetical protein QGG36_26540 [Pirellulaceae bacterium]|jgi:hypothetical protein|nr:hypothetical protein [Pirellulaceae bacterium]MDP7019384.1 hypothetical protein [Pirellulaceae bacterium]
MKLWKTLKSLIVVIAAVGALLPQAGALADARAQISDVALAAGGQLRGQAVTPNGQSAKDAIITLVQRGETVAKTKADKDGLFQFSGLRGGVYAVAVNGQTRGVFRAWAPRTAPPAASQAVLVVADGQAARGIYVPLFGDLGLGEILVVGAAGGIVGVAARDRAS